MRQSLILVFALAVAASAAPCNFTNINRGLLGDLFGDALNVFTGQLAALKEIAQGVTDKTPITTIIQNVVHDHPEALKGLVWFTAVCQLPTLQKIPFVGTGCKFIDDNANKFEEFISGKPLGTGAPAPAAAGTAAAQKGLFTNIWGDALNVFSGQIAALKEIHEGIQAKQPITEIIQKTIGDHPELLKGMFWLTAVCQLPTVDHLPFVGSSCTFIDQHANDFLKAIANFKAPTKEQVEGAIKDKVTHANSTLADAIAKGKEEAAKLAAGAKQAIDGAIAKGQEDAAKVDAAAKQAVAAAATLAAGAKDVIDGAVAKGKEDAAKLGAAAATLAAGAKGAVDGALAKGKEAAGALATAVADKVKAATSS